jgi:hypothetical protein
MAERPALHRDDLVHPVTAVGRGGETEEVAGRRVPDCSLEREGGQVAALVDHDQAVGAEERIEIVDRFEALDRRQIDVPGPLAPAAASLARTASAAAPATPATAPRPSRARARIGRIAPQA